ncbi:hypothetical protein [Mycobacteroides abscessus]
MREGHRPHENVAVSDARDDAERKGLGVPREKPEVADYNIGDCATTP